MNAPKRPQLNDLLSAAMDKIRAGANPNQPLRNLCGEMVNEHQKTVFSNDLERERYLSKSVLHLFVERLNVAAVQELLDHGATTERRTDQPSNLIVVAIKHMEENLTLSLTLNMLNVVLPGSTHRAAPDEEVSIKNKTIEIMSVLKEHGVRCDEQSIKSADVDHPSDPHGQHLDPFMAMIGTEAFRRLTAPDEICMHLIDHHHANPQLALEVARGNTPPILKMALFGSRLPIQAIAVLEQCQALYDRHELISNIPTDHPPQNLRKM